jgi:hypothetical protein
LTDWDGPSAPDELALEAVPLDDELPEDDDEEIEDELDVRA